jgi:hypothetical protein
VSYPDPPHLFAAADGRYLDQLSEAFAPHRWELLSYHELLPSAKFCVEVREADVAGAVVAIEARRLGTSAAAKRRLILETLVGAPHEGVTSWQVELVGPGIAGNPLGLEQLACFVSDIRVEPGADYETLVAGQPLPPRRAEWYLWTFDEFAAALRGESSALNPQCRPSGLLVAAQGRWATRCVVDAALLP